MFALGLKLLFGTFTQLIFIILFYEFNVVYRLKQLGQADLLVFNNINPVINKVLILEFAISLSLIVYGFLKSKKNNQEDL